MNSLTRFDKKLCPFCKGIENNILCPICRGAGFIMVNPPHVKKKLQNNKSRESASRTKKPFGPIDRAIIADMSISCAQAAKRLHRSIKSIESARYRLRQKEKEDG